MHRRCFPFLMVAEASAPQRERQGEYRAKDLGVAVTAPSATSTKKLPSRLNCIILLNLCGLLRVTRKTN
jgi:hypothetical protein